MLLSAYSGSIAAAFADSEPTLVSHWTFDETAGPSFANSGHADLSMTIVGTWADLSTASMVQGIGGTSAYTGGSGHATLPANDPDHDLSELTISFYYQPNSAADKHILLAASDALSTGVGDFSIEVLTNGRLRGFHVGSDSQLRFFQSPSGITGTNLHDGEAHRIDLSFGQDGAKIYLDGTPLPAAFIPLNTNGWNNTRVKYLGSWIDGALGAADGAFDRMRVWDQQLSDGQIASLEPAQTIMLAQPAGVSVGTLAAFTRSTIDVTALQGWPAGKLPKHVLQQGAHASAYIRRPWKPSLNTGSHIDFVPGWQKTTGQEAIRLQLDDDSQIDLSYTVGHTIPSPTGGGVTRTLDRSGGGDFTTWAAAVAALTSGDVLVVRAPAGAWTDSGGHPIPNYVYDVSTSPAPSVSNVTVVAHPDDVAAGRRPIIWRNAGRYARFLYDAANAWQVHADLGGGNVVYQSVATSTQPGHSIFAAYRDQVGDWISMYNYQAITDGADRSGTMHDTTYAQYSGINNSGTYMGPSCIYNKTTGRFEVRLNAPAQQTYQNPSAGLPWPPWDWTMHYPSSTDARNAEIVITDGDSIGSRNALVNLDGKNGWKFYNIDFVWGNRAISAHNQSTPPQFYGCAFLGGAPPDFDNTGSDADYAFTPSAVERFNGTPSSDMILDRCSLHGSNPPWGSWAEGKGFEGAFGLCTRREFTSYTASRVLLRYCHIARWWHLTWMAAPPFTAPVKWHFHHNYIRDSGMDGMLLQRTGGEHVVNRCFLPSCCYGGWTDVGGLGSLFHWSFNVDLRLTAWCCTFPNQNKWANGSEDTVNTPCYPHAFSIPHGGQSRYSERRYHNTCVGSQNTIAATAFTVEGVGSGMGTDSTGTNHRVFNNIGAVYPSPVAWPVGRSALVALYNSASSQIDYNVLYKHPSMLNPVNGSNTLVKVNGSSGAGTAHADIAALRSGTGFEINGAQADPQFVVTPAWASSNPFGASGAYQLGNYMLGGSSPALTGGRNLNDQSFPDYDFETLTTFTGGNNTLFRGALDPSIPLVEQEVGIVGPAPPEIV